MDTPDNPETPPPAEEPPPPPPPAEQQWKGGQDDPTHELADRRPDADPRQRRVGDVAAGGDHLRHRRVDEQ